MKDEAKDCKNEFDLLEGAEEYNNELHKKNKKMEVQKFGKMIMLNMHTIFGNGGIVGNINLSILQRQRN